MKRSVNGKVMLYKFVLEADIESLIRYKAKLWNWLRLFLLF
jgi:hypothetical protein